MRAEHLDYEELLQLDPDHGVIRFAGQRALLLDAVAMGLLRRYLAENFGVTAARAVLTQFGFAHGWRMAEALKSEIPWDSDDDWRSAAARIHGLQGLFKVASASTVPTTEEGVMLVESYEAEQHLLHFGQWDAAACWTICGLTSGYMSRTFGDEVFVLEDRCVAKGDSACHLIGRTRDEWGHERSEELVFFESDRLAEALEVSLQKVTETLKEAEQKLKETQQALVHVAPEIDAPLGIIAKSPAMQKAVYMARRLAKVDSTVMITGESGAGKERIARLIHSESARSTGPFIPINCGAITEALLESELFGHVKGAFTGANQDRAGLFEAAHKGTILLDEVGDVSQAMQMRLLRVLQEREVRRVGENRSRPVDVRVLAATHQDLVKAVSDGTLRQDLYYRLKVVDLPVPPLRERREDLLPLARLFLQEAAQRMDREVTGFSPAVADQLMRYDWPGNVRQLENAMERGAALATDGRVEVEDLPEEVREAFARPVPGRGGVRPLHEVEKEYILAALDENDGNQTATAEQLEIASSTLYRKLKKYRADDPDAG